MGRANKIWQNLKKYPSALIGAGIIAILLAISLTAAIVYPLPEAIRLWRGSDAAWQEAPKNAAPAWTNIFRSQKLPETIIVRAADLAPEAITTEALSPTITHTTYDLVFDYSYKYYPPEMGVFFESNHASLKPQVTLSWITPDGRQLSLFKNTIGTSSRYNAGSDAALRRALGNVVPTTGLFFGPDERIVDGVVPDPQEGEYRLRVDMMTFEEGAVVDVKLVVFGHVYGLAGTDFMRRDLMVGLLWGTPIALMFGLLAAVGTSVLSFFIAAIGAYRGGWIDATIQRITEVNLMLPTLPILIMVGTFYSSTILSILGIIILLNIFSGAIKTNRAIFMQVKNAPYIEAARAYGASSWRIIFRYMVPRIAPTLIPGFVILTPAFVFTEATLAVLGLGDPSLPTWGKILSEAYRNGALYQGEFYWVLEPALMLVVTGLAFSMLGYALDRILNPRLREQ